MSQPQVVLGSFRGFCDRFDIFLITGIDLHYKTYKPHIAEVKKVEE